MPDLHDNARAGLADAAAFAGLAARSLDWLGLDDIKAGGGAARHVAMNEMLAKAVELLDRYIRTLKCGVKRFVSGRLL
jgi:hypothetical protein